MDLEKLKQEKEKLYHSKQNITEDIKALEDKLIKAENALSDSDKEKYRINKEIIEDTKEDEHACIENIDYLETEKERGRSKINIREIDFSKNSLHDENALYLIALIVLLTFFWVNILVIPEILLPLSVVTLAAVVAEGKKILEITGKKKISIKRTLKKINKHLNKVKLIGKNAYEDNKSMLLKNGFDISKYEEEKNILENTLDSLTKKQAQNYYDINNTLAKQKQTKQVNGIIYEEKSTGKVRR